MCIHDGVTFQTADEAQDVTDEDGRNESKCKRFIRMGRERLETWIFCNIQKSEDLLIVLGIIEDVNNRGLWKEQIIRFGSQRIKNCIRIEFDLVS